MSHDPHGHHGPHGHPEGASNAIYQHQMAREHLVSEWFDLLDVTSGTHLVDIGSGPGRIVTLGAELVGPNGAIYALDRDPDALAYLEREGSADAIEIVHPVVTDATALGVRFDRPVVAMMALMLHHAQDPRAVFESVAEALAADSQLLVVEYDPGAPGATGPPLTQRIDSTRIESWLTAVGFAVEGQYDLEEESYGVLARL